MKLPAPPELLREFTPLFEEFCQPCVAFSFHHSKTSPLGGSKLGGRPDLPFRFAWPIHNARPLDFLVQINLAEAGACDVTSTVPKSGLLSFFYDLEEDRYENPGKFRVIYTAAEVTLRAAASPRGRSGVPRKAIRFRPGMSLPHFCSCAFQRLRERAGFSDDDDEMMEAYSEYFFEVSYLGDAKQEGSRHRMLGHPENVQDDVACDAQRAAYSAGGRASFSVDALYAEVEKWVLLLQLDSDEDARTWGDSGVLYFLIRNEDLAQLRFDRVQAVLQSC